jgi:hypothetical protein
MARLPFPAAVKSPYPRVVNVVKLKYVAVRTSSSRPYRPPEPGGLVWSRLPRLTGRRAMDGCVMTSV